MNSCASSVILVGVKPRLVGVEEFVGGGGSSCCLVGLLDAADRKAKELVRVATESSELTFPDRRVVVNLDESSLILEQRATEAIAYRTRRQP